MIDTFFKHLMVYVMGVFAPKHPMIDPFFKYLMVYVMGVFASKRLHILCYVIYVHQVMFAYEQSLLCLGHHPDIW